METTEATLFTSRQKTDPMTEWRLFLQLFMGLVLIGTAGAACPVELSPPRVVVKHGDPASVTCSTSETDFEGLGWEATQGGIGLTPAPSLTWTVENATDWDLKPICFILYKDGHQCLKNPELVIYTFPESISISISTSEMTEGMENDLACNIFHIAPVKNLTVRWYKGDTIINQTNINLATTKPQNLSPVHRFTPTRSDSNTTLRCEAHLDLGPEGPLLSVSSQEFYIKEVKFGPDIRCSSFALLEKKTLEGKCSVTGNPTPHVEWLKEGRLVNLTAPFSRNDAGTYMIKVEGLISIKKNITIDVLYGPERTCPDTYTTLEHSNQTLTCSVGFPKPEEIWFHDEEEVELPQILTRRNAGQYRVIATNALSARNFTIDIKILYPPSQIFELEDVEVNAGESLGLKCSSVAYPKPNYSWSYYRAANVFEETEDGVSRLTIHSAAGYNTGEYTCRAWTEQGAVFKTIQVTVKGAELECPIEISPKEVVLQYQGTTQSVECKSKTNETNVKEIFWTQQGDKISNTHWVADTDGDWDPQLVCYGEFIGMGNCSKALQYTLYKTPESVSISVVNNSRLPLEGTELQLQCDIISVAPAQNLNVLWTFYRGNKTIEPLANASCSFSPESSERLPVNVSCIMNITLKRFHNGIEVQCGAELNLGLTGRQLQNMSNIVKASVLYEPKINITKLPDTVLVFRDSPEELVCEADGNPIPEIYWEYASEILKSNGTLVVHDAGLYTCIAKNNYNITKQVVKVILIVDYLPLIAGFVALAVVIIFVVFIFIYSIYYKNTKTRRYSLKNPKFSSQNSNVAHNGWDIQLPVTKLS